MHMHRHLHMNERDVRDVSFIACVCVLEIFMRDACWL